MNRYALFSGEDYYPSGGWRDFKRSTATVEEARPNEEDNFSCEWWHVVDLETGELVAAHDPHEQGSWYVASRLRAGEE